jgi:hypothetical protein
MRFSFHCCGSAPWNGFVFRKMLHKAFIGSRIGVPLTAWHLAQLIFIPNSRFIAKQDMM